MATSPRGRRGGRCPRVRGNHPGMKVGRASSSAHAPSPGHVTKEDERRWRFLRHEITDTVTPPSLATSQSSKHAQQARALLGDWTAARVLLSNNYCYVFIVLHLLLHSAPYLDHHHNNHHNNQRRVAPTRDLFFFLFGSIQTACLTCFAPRCQC